jgi:hypothetical protein
VFLVQRRRQMKGVHRAKEYTQRPHIPEEKKTKNIRCVRVNINIKKKRGEKNKTDSIHTYRLAVYRRE